jgi:hypothetical protein
VHHVVALGLDLPRERLDLHDLERVDVRHARGDVERGNVGHGQILLQISTLTLRDSLWKTAARDA